MNSQPYTWEETTPITSWHFLQIDVMKQLPNLLRLLGTTALLIAMYSFLIKGWQSGNDVFRYLLMLGHTTVLAAVGIATGHWLKESKSARLLLTLALVSVPANFAILGAFIFSQTTAVDVSHYPHYVAWSVNSLSTALLATGGAVILLVPITVLGFTVLARSLSKPLSLRFLLSNAVLLFPLRDPHLIGLLVLGLMLSSIVFSYKASHENIVTKTHEGITSLGLQFLPVAVLMGRSLWLYSADMFLLSVLAISIFYLLRQAALIFDNETLSRRALDRLSLLPAIAVTPLLASALFESTLLLETLSIPVAAIISALMIYDIAKRQPGQAHYYRYIASGMLMVSMLLNICLFTGVITAIISIAVGTALLILGFQKQQRGVFVSGFVLVLVGLAQQLYELVHHFDLGSWASFASLGVIAIIIASIMESQGQKFKPRIEQWKATFKQWEK